MATKAKAKVTDISRGTLNFTVVDPMYIDSHIKVEVDDNESYIKVSLEQTSDGVMLTLESLQLIVDTIYRELNMER